MSPSDEAINIEVLMYDDSYAARRNLLNRQRFWPTPSKPLKPAPITKQEIAETLGWDRVPGVEYNATTMIPGASSTLFDPRD